MILKGILKEYILLKIFGDHAIIPTDLLIFLKNTHADRKRIAIICFIRLNFHIHICYNITHSFMQNSGS